MNNYKSFTELKGLTYQQVNGKLGLLIGSMLLQQFITFFASSFISALIPTNNIIGYLLNYIVLFILQILAFVLQSGLYFIHLQVACNISCSVSDLFEGFRSNTDKIIKISAILAFISSICTIPSDIMYTKMLDLSTVEITTHSAFTAYYNSLMLYSLVSLACMLLYFLVTLPFFPVFYMIWDYPDSNASKLLKRSIEVMKGNKCRYLLLQLSFVPSILLSFFICGVSLLWVIPLMNITSANFYLDLISVQNKK